MFALRFLAGVALTVPPRGPHPPAQIVHMMLLWLLATTSIYLFNGVQDIAADRLNGSRRPLASGMVSAGFARSASVAGTTAALLGTLQTDLPLIAPMTALVILGYAYSAPPLLLAHRTSGTLLTVLLASLLSVLAGHLSDTSTLAEAFRFGPALLLFALVSAGWAALVGGLVKDLGDIPGDRAAGRRTWAVVYGPGAVRRFTSVAGLFLGAIFVWCALTLAPVLVPAALATLTGAVVLALVNRSDDTDRPDASRSRLRRSYRTFMLTQYAAHLLALVAVVAVL
jgi:4-hydroxybenzoate polyprenyltransferase